MTLPVPWKRWRFCNTARKTNQQNYAVIGTKYQNGLHKQKQKQSSYSYDQIGDI